MDKIKGDGIASDIKRDYRAIFCPKCNAKYIGKFFTEVVVCNTCGYKKL